MIFCSKGVCLVFRVVSHIYALTCSIWWKGSHSGNGSYNSTPQSTPSQQLPSNYRYTGNHVLICGRLGCLSFSSRKFPGHGKLGFWSGMALDYLIIAEFFPYLLGINRTLCIDRIVIMKIIKVNVWDFSMCQVLDQVLSIVLIILPTALRGSVIVTPLCSWGNWHAEAPAEQGRSTKNWFSENPGGQWWQPCFTSPLQPPPPSNITTFGWLAPKQNFQIHPKGKEKALGRKEQQAPFLKMAYSDTGILQIPVSLRSYCFSKISNFSKSIKPACVKHTIQKQLTFSF